MPSYLIVGSSVSLVLEPEMDQAKSWSIMRNHSGKKKAHKHKLFGPVGVGMTPGLSQG